MPVAATPTIDTTNLLTILGVVAAAWAVISPTARLSFRLCMTRLDWVIIVTLVLAIHFLVFEEVFRAIGLYPELGPWRWGMDKNGLVYLFFLSLTAFVFWRSRTFRLSTRKLPLFEQLTTSLLHSRKFAELGELLNQHLGELLAAGDVGSYRSRLAERIAPSAERRLTAVARQATAQSPIRRTLAVPRMDRWRSSLAHAIRVHNPSDANKRAILKALFSSSDLVTYLALAHPYLCLSAMTQVTEIVEDFQDGYFEALLANTSSVFFQEIRNSRNLNGGNRVRLPEENRLLNFYCKDVSVAAGLAVYSAVGEAMLIRLESDDALADNLNKPLLRYDEKGKYSCPIYCGLYFFRIMVLEGLYQHVADHLWLHYVAHIVDRILRRMRPELPEDANHEFATPFNYLLYSVVAVTTDWIEDSIHVTEDTAVLSPDQTEAQHAYISFQAAEALGGVMQSALSSDKVTERLKVELLENILFMLRRLARKRHLEPVIRAVLAYLMNPYGMGLNAKHLSAIERIYMAQDHVLRGDTRVFAQVLATAKGSLAGGASFPMP